MMIDLQIAIKRAQLEIARQAYNDIDELLQKAKANLCYALGEYDRAVREKIKSLK